jgi:hypothetical protein
MLKWLRGKTAPKSSAASPELDFKDPDAEKFAVSLNVWRKSLEARRSQDTKLDQSGLTFMAPDALAELDKLQAARRTEATAKKRTATLKAKAKLAAAGEKPAPTNKLAVNKTAKPKEAEASKKDALKPAAKKPAVKKQAAVTKSVKTKKPAAKTALKNVPAKPTTKKAATASKKTAAKPKPRATTNEL